MPWLSEAKKDVISCEKPRGGANILRSADIRMGQPAGSDSGMPQSGRRTRGTETSKYPEEEKTKVMARVVASESAPAQTGGVEAPPGVVGPPMTPNGQDSGSAWKRAPQRVTAPYAKSGTQARRHLSSAGHEKSCVNLRGPSRKAKHYRETDSEPVP